MEQQTRIYLDSSPFLLFVFAPYLSFSPCEPGGACRAALRRRDEKHGGGPGSPLLAMMPHPPNDVKEVIGFETRPNFWPQWKWHLSYAVPSVHLMCHGTYRNAIAGERGSLPTPLRRAQAANLVFAL